MNANVGCCQDSGVPKEPSSGGMQWPGTAQAATTSPGFAPSPGFPEASPAKDPGLLHEPSSGGMQQPGTAQDEPLESTGGANWRALPEAGSSSSEESSAEESLPARPSTMLPEEVRFLPVTAIHRAEGSSSIPEAKESAMKSGALDWPGTSQAAADSFQESSSGMAWPDLTSSMAGFASSFPSSPGFPDAPKQESTSGGMQWPDTSANSQEGQSLKWPSSEWRATSGPRGSNNWCCQWACRNK
eukprot:symbB.v1.2.017022.t3/scaffold1285.1/size129168/1